ncbi:MAG: ABC transporter permease [Planctomycetaceae bacterium]
MNQQKSEIAPGGGQPDGTPAALPRKTKLPKGESQWMIVWRQFRKRKLAVASVCIIWLLISVSIWAPFIANDRPLMYVGYNRQEYQESARTARIMLTQFIEQKWKTAKTPWLEWRGTQIETLMLQVELMGQQLSGSELEELRKLQAEFLRAVTVDDPDDVDVESLTQLRTVLRQQFDGAKVVLSSRQFWPVLRSLSGVEFGFLIWSIAIVVWPILSWVIRRTILLNSERQISSALTWFAIVVLPIIAGLIWHVQVPLRLDRTNYKSAVLANQIDRLSKANVVFEGVIWPPISYGLDEDHLSRKFARPAIMPPENAPAEPSTSSGSIVPRGELGPWDSPHWLGTDDIGRDILARMIWGGRVSLTVGIVAVGIYVTIGIVVGAISGYFRGAADMIISRIIEVVICFPSFFLILTIVAFLGPSIFNIMVVIGVTGWTGIARLVRAEFLRLAEQEFVLAGRALGYSPWRIIFKHVLPNALAPVMVSATFGIAGAILTESALSFLGFGITVPMPSWGGILSSGREAIFRAPWLIYFPGTAIFITITAYNLVGEALRDAADPRLRN